MLNRAVICGRMARDPSLKMTQTGIPMVSFTLAVDRDFKDKATGERATDWIDCIAYRNQAEFISKYFGKGCLAVVEGRLQIREWTGRDGNKRRTAEIMVDNVYFGDSKRPGEKPMQSEPQYPPLDDSFQDISDDKSDLPF